MSHRLFRGLTLLVWRGQNYLFQIIGNNDQNVRNSLVQELMMDTDDHNDKTNEGFQ